MIDKKRFYLAMVFSSLGGAFIALFVFRLFFFTTPELSIEQKQRLALLSSEKMDKKDMEEDINFVKASRSVTPAVVYIHTSHHKKNTSFYSDEKEWFRQYHGEYFPKQATSGSGVIVTEDGFVVTNNHVVEEAEVIEVVLPDKRSYEARLIGADPTTDLALLKIEAKGLPFVPYGNSDKIHIGDWVLAVGNPFDFLTSTVTAGIISAKGRDINIIQEQDGLQVEAFLQTDAVVNPGNSGGALVNLQGELVGINTAIASQSGKYEGYSFAVPVNLVKKVIDDLSKYGAVQRALLGVEITEIDASFAREKKLEIIEGVYVARVDPNGSAATIGLQPGDIILKIDGKVINTTPELQSIIASKRPGETVKVVFKHLGTQKEAAILLKNRQGNLDIVKKAESSPLSIMGAEFSNTTDREKQMLKIQSGVKIVKIEEGKLMSAGIEPGFIITKVRIHRDNIVIRDVADILAILKRAENRNELFYIEGVYPNGERAYYPITE